MSTICGTALETSNAVLSMLYILLIILGLILVATQAWWLGVIFVAAGYWLWKRC